MTFPHKDKKTLRGEVKDKVDREIEVRKQIAELDKELNGEADSLPRKSRKKRTAEMIYYEKNYLEKELEKLTQMEKNGWVLVDFPATFA